MCWTKGPRQSTGPCCSFLMKGGGWKGSLSIACSVPQASLCRHTTGGLHHATTLKKPILKQSQRQTLTLETGTCPLTPGSPQLFEGGGMFEPASKPVVTFKPTRDQKVCSVRALCYFFLLVHMHTLYTLHYT